MARNVTNRSTPLNHYFALICWDQNYGLPPVPANFENGQFFITLAAYPSLEGNILTRNYGNLIFTENDGFDIRAARMFLNSSLTNLDTGNFDPKAQQVTPPHISPTGFARRLTNMAFNYRRNTQNRPVEYVLTGPNSNSWINSLFNAAGVLYSDRLRYSNFVGIDVGEDTLIDSHYFRY